METLGTKVVVLGAGGAGSKMLDRLATAIPPNAELIAIDTDSARLGSLNQNIKPISIGSAISACKNIDEMRTALGSEMQVLESSIHDAELVIILMGMGGKAGSCLGSMIAETCTSKGIFTLSIATYPLMRMGSLDGVKGTAENLREHSSGVIIIDNNLNLEGDNISVTDVFDKINSVVCELVMLVLSSISGTGYMSLSADELRQFFHGDVFFSLTAGKGVVLSDAADRALGNVLRYTGHSGVKRMLVMAAGPTDISIEEIRALNDRIENEFKAESVKWACAYANDFEVLAISAVEDIPLLRGIELPSHAPHVSVPVVETPKAVMEEAKKPEAIAAKGPETITPKEPEKKPSQAAYFNFSTMSTYKTPPIKLRSPALVGIKKEEQPLQKRAPTPDRFDTGRSGVSATGRSGPNTSDIETRGREREAIDIYSLSKKQQYANGPKGRPTENNQLYRGEQYQTKNSRAIEDEGRKGVKGDDMGEMIDDIVGFPYLPPQGTYQKKPGVPQKKIGDYDELDLKYV